jgi:nicotinamidase-related amidase
VKRHPLERSPSALLVVDVINHFEFPGGPALLRIAERVALAIARIMRRTRAADVPVIYCNDLFGQWRSDFRRLFDVCAAPAARGQRFVRRMQPAPSDYFILKPKHSAFFATPLELLLQDLGVERLLVIGLATDGCVLTTALDGHARDYDIAIARDAVAAQSDARTRRALDLLRAASPIRVTATRAAMRWLGV